jgi:energy-coupling factor transporter ATP-binding protein EcfA2
MSLESGNGFQVIGEWLGLSANQFKQYVFFAASILLEAVMLLCTLFLTVTTSSGGGTKNTGETPPRSRKPNLFKRLFPSFKLPSVFQPTPSSPNGVRALNIQEKIDSADRNIQEYSKRNTDGNLTFRVSGDGNINASLDEFPHIIIAGRTGSGKSNFTRSILLQLLHKNDPNQLQLIIIDLKNAEFFRYENLPHLIKPILSAREPNYREKAIEYLTFLEGEVLKRQGILYDAGCRDYQGYILKNRSAPYPYLLVLIEEISVISNNKQIQERLRNLTSLSRSTGTSIVLTTQYPYARVVGTDITGNCGGKFCFKVETIAQSLTILGSRGAEGLKGNGHGIFSNNGNKIEFHAPLVEDSYEENITAKYSTDSKRSNIIPFPKSIPSQDRNIPNILENIPDLANSNENIPTEDIPKSEQSELAKKWYGEGMKQIDIAKKLGVPQGTVSKLLRKRA